MQNSRGDRALVVQRYPQAVCLRVPRGGWVVRNGLVGPMLGEPSANRRGAWHFAARQLLRERKHG